jgi:hypothetical protein
MPVDFASVPRLAAFEDLRDLLATCRSLRTVGISNPQNIAGCNGGRDQRAFRVARVFVLVRGACCFRSIRV